MSKSKLEFVVNGGVWTIEWNPKPIPDGGHDWDFVHEEFDWAPDGVDHRCGTGGTIYECIEQILEIEEYPE